MPQRDFTEIDPEHLAGADPFARQLGLVYVDGAPGRATLRLVIEQRHLNFNGACHGAVLFALADSTFGLACNVGGRLSVALDAHVTYAAPAWPGDVLEATAREVTRSKQVAIYRAEITRAGGEVIATFTATAFLTDRQATPAA